MDDSDVLGFLNDQLQRDRQNLIRAVMLETCYAHPDAYSRRVALACQELLTIVAQRKQMVMDIDRRLERAAKRIAE